MSTDPFDRLRAANPLSDDRLPEPPMSMAERILEARRASWGQRSWPGWAVGAAAAVLVAALGGAWMLWLGPGDGTVAAAASTTTSAASSTTATTSIALQPTTTITPTSTTEAPVQQAGAGVIYLLVDDPTSFTGGPFLMPSERTFAILSAPVTDPLATTLAFLMVGPTPGETDGTPSITSAIPEGTALNRVTVVDGIAEIDLTPQFTSGGGTLSMVARVAQVAFTATRFPDVDGIRISIDGEPLTVLGGEGLILDDPITRDGSDDLLPAVLIEEPANWAQVGNPLVVSGSANVFEATVSLALTDADGLILWEGFTTATCGTGCRGEWTATIPYEVAEPQFGSLIAWETSAEDGRQTNVREHRVWLTPAGGTPPDDGSITLPDATTGTTLAAGEWTITERWVQLDTGVSRIHMSWPEVAGPGPAPDRIQAEIDAIVDDALRAFAASEAAMTSEGEQPNDFGLGFEVRWLTDRFLTVVFEEYYGVATAAHPFTDRFVTNFDLATGASLHTDDLLTADGIDRLTGLVEQGVAIQTGDPTFCCDADPTAQAAVLPGGLLVVLDELDGLPHAWGMIDVLATWDDLDGLLAPAGLEVRASTPPCSAWGLVGPGPADGLPPAVAAMRDALANAASLCDFEALAELAVPGVTYSFGAGTDPIGYWAGNEARGFEPLRYLSELLDRPYAVMPNGDMDLYVWPSAATTAWSDVPEADREALRPLYGDEDFAAYEDFGAYIGLRVGITEDGLWMFFVSGD